MQRRATNRKSRFRYVATVVIAAWMALAVTVIGGHDGSHSSLLCLQSSTGPSFQTPVRSRNVDFIHNAHPWHLDKGAPADHHEPLMATVLPPSAANPVLGNVATTPAAVAAWLAGAAMLGGQGPHGSADVCAGRNLLTRFCLARR